MTTAAAPPARSYFARGSVQAIVIGAFFALTLPLVTLGAALGPRVEHWVELYGVTFGLTHFLITGLVYLDSRNLRYFASSWRNRLVYFVVPVAIFVLMDVQAVLPLGEVGPYLRTFLYYFVMLVNFLHVSRQSFGVLQLFKRESAATFRSEPRPFENLFFVALVVGQFLTFANGGVYDAASLGGVLVSVLIGLIFLVVVGSHVAALRRGGRFERRDWLPLVYFLLQAASGALVVWKSGLVQVALAMHYVEYHVVMMPRFFDAPIDRSSRVDRLRSVLGGTKVLAYAGLLMVAWGFWLGQRTVVYTGSEDASLAMRLLVHSLDGLFLFHFFVEAFIWKFSRPHYRETLGPLYFAPAVEREGAATAR